jgi:hypothetical protein
VSLLEPTLFGKIPYSIGAAPDVFGDCRAGWWQAELVGNGVRRLRRFNQRPKRSEAAFRLMPSEIPELDPEGIPP